MIFHPLNACVYGKQSSKHLLHHWLLEISSLEKDLELKNDQIRIYEEEKHMHIKTITQLEKKLHPEELDEGEL